MSPIGISKGIIYSLHQVVAVLVQAEWNYEDADAFPNI